MRAIENISDLEAGVAALIASEPRFEKAVRVTGIPPLRRSQPGFAGVLKIITGQQVSKASAAAIWERMMCVLSPFDPEHFAGLSGTQFREAGLSGPKIRAIECLTDAVLAGALDFSTLEQAGDEEASKLLTSVKGIGPWSADVYLLSCLGRPDVWPAGDLALQVAAADLFNYPDRLSENQMQDIAAPWQPWRAVAARILWAWYAQMKRGQDQGL